MNLLEQDFSLPERGSEIDRALLDAPLELCVQLLQLLEMSFALALGIVHGPRSSPHPFISEPG